MGGVIQVESGGEKFIGYAKKKLRELHDYMLSAGLGSFNKRIDVSDGSVIYIKSLHVGNEVFADKIRITGGVVTYLFQKIPDWGDDPVQDSIDTIAGLKTGVLPVPWTAQNTLGTLDTPIGSPQIGTLLGGDSIKPGKTLSALFFGYPEAGIFSETQQPPWSLTTQIFGMATWEGTVSGVATFIGWRKPPGIFDYPIILSFPPADLFALFGMGPNVLFSYTAPAGGALPVLSDDDTLFRELLLTTMGYVDGKFVP